MSSVYSVSQVNSYIKNLFTQDFALNRITVRGEISNCKYHPSGHIYFTLKDGGSQIGAVMFASQTGNLFFRLEEGQQVLVEGTVDVYERDGRYQLYAKKIRREGNGELFERFEKLRDELEEMGMFDGCYKRPIPRYARTVGIVTASTGAAIRDIMNIAKRRNPYVQLILCPALVQGEEAKYSIVQAIRRLDARKPDVMIVGRGGGSIEDLWAFNEEMVARAIFECETPVISAVGHETDVTIADYVADLRAPTPSAAAELAVFDYSQFEAQKLLLEQTLTRGMRRCVERTRFRLRQNELCIQMHHPQRKVNDHHQHLADLQERMERAMQGNITKKRHQMALLCGRLESLSPLSQLKRGYGFITDSTGAGLRSVDQLHEGDAIRVHVADGSAVALVQNVEREE